MMKPLLTFRVLGTAAFLLAACTSIPSKGTPSATSQSQLYRMLQCKSRKITD